MESSFDQEIHNCDMKEENSSGLAAIEQDVEHNPSFSVVLETGEEHKDSNAATPDIDNAFNLIIKREPEMDHCGSENIPLELAKNVDANDANIKQEHKFIVQSRNRVIDRKRNLVFIHSDSAFNDFNGSSIKEEAQVKNEINEPENKEMQEIDYKERKMKNEEMNIMEDFEDSETSILPNCVDQDNKLCERSASPECDHCSDKTVRETSLKGLHLHHKYPKGRKVGIKCSYQTGYQHAFKKHVKNQEIEIFKCYKCDFQTINEYSLKNHLRRHYNSDDVKKFKCDQCSYKSIEKSNLQRHLLRHVSPEEVVTFKCNKCNFQTMYKHYLQFHLVRHNNSEDVKKFKCDQCSYRCIAKTSLKRHIRLHGNPENIDRFKCDKCDFQTVHKQSLKFHLLRHNNSDDVKKFKCDQCSYKTIEKSNLKKHLLRHGDGNVEMFKCNECDYQTMQKGYLTTHSLRHISPEEVDI